MYIKIYFDDKPLFLTDSITKEIEPFAHHDDAVLIDEFSPAGIKSMIHEMRSDRIHAGIFKYDKVEELKKAFWKKFDIVRTAGGLILNAKNEVLLIFRRGKWDLPKGKVDPGETLEECLVREIDEETGIKNPTIVRPLITTYHTYDENGKHILKENYWYLLQIENVQDLVPQQEEQITEVKWVPANEIDQYMSNTFPSIVDVMVKWKNS